MTTSRTTNTVTVSKSLLAIVGSIAALGLLGGTFALGMISAGPASSRSASGGTQSVTPGTTTTSTAPTGTTSTAGGPFAVGRTVNFQTPVLNLTGRKTTLARGSKGTIIVAMASWCLYCGYDDKYVMPLLAKTPGVAIDIVDISPQGGIADPGPQNPPFSGHDGTGGALTTAGMESIMRQYVTTYGTLNASNIHVYVAPTRTQTAWNVQSTPTIAYVSANGKTVVAPPGAQTISQAQSALKQTMGN